MTTQSPAQRQRGDRPPTIAFIAQQAGVSVPTVSKVINGRADVSSETRSRVEAAIREHGYRRAPRPSARSPLIEVIVNELESEWALEIIRGVERVAGQHDLAVVISEMQGRRGPGRGWIDGVIARRPMGVIAVFAELSDTMREQLRARDIPFVVVDPLGEPVHDTLSVGATNWNGGLAATRHLLGLGHRRIGVIGGPRGVLCSRARIDGYRAAMDEAGVQVDPALISHGAFHVAEGIERGRALLTTANRPTAIFAGNDLQALGVYQAARDLRLHIPEDLSVVGFDDLPVARWVGPPLTTIRQPLAEMAATAAELALAMARGETPAQPRIELATELVIRESTAPPSREPGRLA
jgi:LacI family transcriptional regulator